VYKQELEIDALHSLITCKKSSRYN